MDEYELMSKAIATVGFPVICCVWMATVGRKSIEKLSESNNNLAEAIKAFGDAAYKHSALLKRIEVELGKIEVKLERQMELLVELKSKSEHTVKEARHD